MNMLIFELKLTLFKLRKLAEFYRMYKKWVIFVDDYCRRNFKN